ncbi:MAG TPA: hypothetical protein VEA40_23625 [Ramlibacter sp.]|nr:hypothetical protein [Ramlibacter sp.]
MNQHYPLLLKQLLHRPPGAAGGGPDLPAFVGGRGGRDRDYVSAGLISRFAIPERVEFVPAIDKTSVGKFDKKRMRQRYGTAKALT